MTEFWETYFAEHQEMWGFEPALSAVLAKDLFVEKGLKNILIPGIGYGRNAQVFTNQGMTVTGIEISQTAIEMAHKHFGKDFIIHHGSVTNMPFDNLFYDGIFCYALLHLLDSSDRQKMIRDCYNQLAPNGYMIFIVVTKNAPFYGKGNCISKDRYEIHKGIKMYFYDTQSIQAEFEKAGLLEITTVNENLPFYFITCKKV